MGDVLFSGTAKIVSGAIKSSNVCSSPTAQRKFGCDSCPSHPTCEAKENNKLQEASEHGK